VPSTPAKSVAEFELRFEESYNQFQLGFLQGSNPKAFSRLLTLAAINASRTMVKPMKAEAVPLVRHHRHQAGARNQERTEGRQGREGASVRDAGCQPQRRAKDGAELLLGYNRKVL